MYLFDCFFELGLLLLGYAWDLAANQIRPQPGEELVKVQDEFKNEDISTVDGVKIDFADNWVHLRKSNTEPIIRIYTEAFSQEEADKIGDNMIEKIRSLI